MMAGARHEAQSKGRLGFEIPSWSQEAGFRFQRSVGGWAGFGFVCLEFQVAGCYAETDEVFVGELDVIGTLSNWGWLCFGDEFRFFGCG